jgi:hypothetical protein
VSVLLLLVPLLMALIAVAVIGGVVVLAVWLARRSPSSPQAPSDGPRAG